MKPFKILWIILTIFLALRYTTLFHDVDYVKKGFRKARGEIRYYMARRRGVPDWCAIWLKED